VRFCAFLENDKTNLRHFFLSSGFKRKHFVHSNLLHWKVMHPAFKRQSTDFTHSLQCGLEFKVIMLGDIAGGETCCGTRLGAQALDAHQHTLFRQIKSTIFSRNLSQKMPKNGCFKKSCKIATASGAQPPNSRWLPAAGNSALRPYSITPLIDMYLSRSAFLKLNLFYYFEKWTKVTNSKWFSFFRAFAPIFHFKLCSFCW